MQHNTGKKGSRPQQKRNFILQKSTEGVLFIVGLQGRSPHIVSVAAILHCICRDLDAYLEGPAIQKDNLGRQNGERIGCRVHKSQLFTGMDIDFLLWKGLR